MRTQKREKYRLHEKRDNSAVCNADFHALKPVARHFYAACCMRVHKWNLTRRLRKERHNIYI